MSAKRSPRQRSATRPGLLAIPISDRQSVLALPHARLRALARQALLAEGRQVGVALAFVDDATMADLHARFLGDPTPTDVMTFPAPVAPHARKATQRGGGAICGEVVVSITTAVRQAPAYRRQPLTEVFEYVVHGILHLCGYDDGTRRDAARLARRQAELVDAYLTRPTRRGRA
ncbi:MAG: rRNA maturation RNase YbeY [Planctomycetota bacterium]